MNLHLITNKSLLPYISHTISFIDDKKAQEYIEENQKILADKSFLLNQYTIDVKGELKDNQTMIYALFNLNDNANYTQNIIPGIKRSRHIEGFYADETALYKAQNDLPLFHNRKFSEIYYVPILDLKPNNIPKCKI